VGQLGKIGYGVYNYKGRILIFHTEGVEVLENKPSYDVLLDSILDAAIEEDAFMDHLWNRRDNESNNY